MIDFKKLSEEEKIDKCFNYALMYCQGFLSNPDYDIPEIKEYREYLKSIVDWLAPKLDMEGLPLYID